VAGTCLYIACKCFETRLTKGDLVFSADNMLNANDVAIAEEVILHELDWKLSYPTIHDFVEMFTDELGLEEESKQRRMARYISELALQSQVYLSFKPSLIASCVVALALVAVGSADPWPDGLKQATGYSWNDLELCMMALSSGIHHVSATMPELKIISRRYRKTQNGRLSLIHIPRITLFASLRTPRA
jgi:transcription initiation factor TFIIIB Brf1 subunit/transcription initiation factor TFIIB